MNHEMYTTHNRFQSFNKTELDALQTVIGALIRSVETLNTEYTASVNDVNYEEFAALCRIYEEITSEQMDKSEYTKGWRYWS